MQVERSRGLVVMGGDSCSEGRGFESQHRIQDWNFFTLICCKIVLMFAWKRQKINEKEAGDGPFLKKTMQEQETDGNEVILWKKIAESFHNNCLVSSLPLSLALRHLPFTLNDFPHCSRQILTSTFEMVKKRHLFVKLLWMSLLHHALSLFFYFFNWPSSTSNSV